MPRSKTKKSAAKKIDFPTMFYREAPMEKILANTAKASAPIRLVTPADLRKRQMIMWGGVIVVMIFLIGLWGTKVKENFQNTGSVKEDLNFLNKTELSDILKKNSDKSAEIKNLSAEQINALKKKIENKL